eukprot:1180344-Prorocentrum_minimum.AAC.2
MRKTTQELIRTRPIRAQKRSLEDEGSPTFLGDTPLGAHVVATHGLVARVYIILASHANGVHFTRHPSMGSKNTLRCLSAEDTQLQGHMISAPKSKLRIEALTGTQRQPRSACIPAAAGVEKVETI